MTMLSKSFKPRNRIVGEGNGKANELMDGSLVYHTQTLRMLAEELRAQRKVTTDLAHVIHDLKDELALIRKEFGKKKKA